MCCVEAVTLYGLVLQRGTGTCKGDTGIVIDSCKHDTDGTGIMTAAVLHGLDSTAYSTPRCSPEAPAGLPRHEGRTKEEYDICWRGRFGGGGGVSDLVLKLSLASMLHLFSCTVQLLVLGPDLVVARLVVLSQIAALPLQPSHFGLKSRHSSRKLVTLEVLFCIQFN